MAKVIDTQTVRDRLGDIINQSHYRGDEFLVQRRGKPLVAIIPYAIYEQLQRQRADAFSVFHQIWDANSNADPEQVANDAREAIAEVRGARRE